MSIIKVNPRSCTPFSRNPRNLSRLTPESCRDLIESIRAEGAQRVPAIVRPIRTAHHLYEVICGTRRHFAVSYLREQGLDIPFVAEQRRMDDAEAFRLTDLENRNRADVSDYERATSYLRALDEIYGGRQADMAAALNVSPSWLSRYLHIARMPNGVMSAFASPDQIKVSHARRVQALLADEHQRPALMAAARKLHFEGEATRSATDVLTTLEAAITKPEQRRRSDGKLFYRAGSQAPALSLKCARSKAVVEFPRSITPEQLRGAMTLMIAEGQWKKT